MPWYHLTAHHGPGHQSITDEYRWYDFEMNGFLLLEEEFRRLTHDLKDPIGTFKKTDRLPEEVRRSKILEYRQKKAHAEAVLKALGDPPMRTDEYIEWLRTLEPAEAGKNLDRLRSEVCMGCGGPVSCQCQNDE